MSGPSPPPDPRIKVFSYAVADKADLYLAVVDALVTAKKRFTLQLRPGEVARQLVGVTAAEVADALEALEIWGNVTKFYDTSAPETLDQFYARRFLYQLTEAGVAAHEGVQAIRRAGLDTGRLSAVLLPSITEDLGALRHEASSDEPDGARLYRLFTDLFGAFAALADNAARYMNDLAVEITTITGDDESFSAYKRAVFAYLDEFVARLATTVPEIAAVITDLDADIDSLIELAAAQDTAPVLEGDDDGVRRSFHTRWSGVTAWFVRLGDEAPIADSLRLAMLDALNRILAAVDRLNERHLRRVSREADFTQLARWFASSSPEESCLLWDRAFGLYPARHFAELAGDEEMARGASFWDAPPAEVAPRLRATGIRAGPGRPGRASDFSAVKAAGLADLRAQHRQAELAVARLAGRTPARLSHLGTLDADEFRQFLAIVDAALLARPRPDGVRIAATPLVTVTLRPFPNASQAAIATPHGTLHGTDQILEIALAGAGRSEAVG